MRAPTFPPADGRCPRCQTSIAAEYICPICGLRLKAGMWGVQRQADVLAAEWSDAHPQLSAAWARLHPIAARPPEAQEEPLTTIEAPDRDLVDVAVTVLGCHGVALREGADYRLRVTPREIVIISPIGGLRYSYSEVLAVDIAGAGETRRGGGFAGGGLGVTGAFEGMVAASVLNAITTRQHLDCVIRIGVRGGEATLQVSGITPRFLRARLAGLYSALDQRASERTSSADSVNVAQIVGELAQLADLLDRGHLTRDEYEQLKARLLSIDQR